VRLFWTKKCNFELSSALSWIDWLELNWTELNWIELNWTELNWTDSLTCAYLQLQLPSLLNLHFCRFSL
jgi:hypothetical protein